MKNYVAYYRVSTQRQGASGLGLEAQRAACHAFVRGTDLIISEYVEVESGKKTNRQQLDAAIAAARAQGATLLIAKLDRLARNVAFTSHLMETGVDFLCVDNPAATRLTIHIFAAIAEHEARTISERTKAALAAKRARGERLGNPANLTEAGRERSREVRHQIARNHQANVQAAAMISYMQAPGKTLQQMADKLNRLGYRTRRGCLFTTCAVYRLSQLQTAPAAA
ncbi:Site-specific DNA recombinase [Hymenobacter gelipurpurascens]|uniref:Site-specific DNA recombinase n=1 Tax=Hymenobacter gelipurpurascens TaxID=89968 RepID=A0A212TI03_9BACT|nr:recombinase family protein [Hymenobacter gelipurpurascens]SNC65484.1 Site-specific DNA recombinase [Hymenobacter gelipurpurascens]